MRTINLTQGQVAIVDDDEILQGRKYYYHKGYAVRNIKLPNGRKTISYLHVEILETVLCRSLVDDEECDHKNLDRLDCRKQNLRLATHGQNGRNVPRYSNNLSGFKGVHWCERDHKWIAKIMVNKNRTNLGYFDDRITAAKAYDRAAIELHGDFARTNFQREDYDV